MTRIKAFLTHFGLSLFIVSAVLTIVLLFWYPSPFFQIIGVTDALQILIFVDIVLGPLLTLVLFKPGKRGLVFDMYCVAIIQVSALCYGVSVLYEERPYYAVFTQDRFDILARKDVNESAIQSGVLPEKPWRQPIYVFASMPTDNKEFQRVMDEVLFEGKPDIQYRPEFWRPYEANLDRVREESKPLDALLAGNPEAADDIDALLNQYNGSKQLGFVPVLGKKQPFALVIDMKTTMPIDIIDADPWKKKANKKLASITDQ
jgi:hypothetical protein